MVRLTDYEEYCGKSQQPCNYQFQAIQTKAIVNKETGEETGEKVIEACLYCTSCAYSETVEFD